MACIVQSASQERLLWHYRACHVAARLVSAQQQVYGDGAWTQNMGRAPLGLSAVGAAVVSLALVFEILRSKV